jgi:RecJ-like exonuclease
MTTRCSACGGTGEADPFEFHEGFPPFADCRCCLGAGVSACAACDGLGMVPVAVPCPACHGEVDQLRAA